MGIDLYYVVHDFSTGTLVVIGVVGLYSAGFIALALKEGEGSLLKGWLLGLLLILLMALALQVKRALVDGMTLDGDAIASAFIYGAPGGAVGSWFAMRSVRRQLRSDKPLQLGVVPVLRTTAGFLAGLALLGLVSVITLAWGLRGEP